MEPTATALTAQQQADIKVALLANYELIIRDMAGTTLSLIATRRSHSSYGVTKASIRSSLDRMEGAIGVYMVLAGQAMHPSIPLLAQFMDQETTDRVTTARTQAGIVK